MLNRLVPALALSLLAACASPGPDKTQEWLTLDEYRDRLEAGTARWPAPVVEVPQGTELTLAFGPHPFKLLKEEIPDLPLDPADGGHLLRVRARRTFYLDLQHLLISMDKAEWSPLGQYVIAPLREARLTVPAGPESRIAVPLWSAADIHLGPDLFSTPRVERK